VVRCIAKKIRKTGHSAIVEPRGSSGGVPDIQLTYSGGQHFIEVSILHPQAPSHRNRARDSLVQSRESRKRKKYQQLLQENAPADLTTVVYDTYGGSGSGVVELERLLTKLSSDQGDDDRTTVNRAAVAEFRSSVAITLQSGNATALLRGCTMAHDFIARGERRQRNVVAQRMIGHALNVGSASSSSSSSSSATHRNRDVRQPVSSDSSAAHAFLSSLSVVPPAPVSAQSQAAASPRLSPQLSLSLPMPEDIESKLPELSPSFSGSAANDREESGGIVVTFDSRIGMLSEQENKELEWGID
jgi:hypothetical protein